MGRALGGPGVQQLRAAVLHMAHGPEEGLRPAGRFFSAAMGAALQMICDPDADLEKLGAQVCHYYSLGLEAWFCAQASSAASAATPSTSPIGVRVGVMRESIGGSMSGHDSVQLIRDFCHAGLCAARDGEGAMKELFSIADQIATVMEKEVSS